MNVFYLCAYVFFHFYGEGENPLGFETTPPPPLLLLSRKLLIDLARSSPTRLAALFFFFQIVCVFI